MIRNRFSILSIVAISVGVFMWGPLPCGAVAAIAGTVVDETSAPLKGVTVSVLDLEDYEDGRWIRNSYSGAMSEFKTDGAGRFLVEVNASSARRYELSFDREGFGPAFLKRVEDGATSLTVVLNGGVPITGTVSRRSSDGTTQPLENAELTLRLPNEGFWYQQRIRTQAGGRYLVRASVVPPGNIKWQIKFLDEVAPLDVVDETAIIGPDFEVNVKVLKLARK